MSRRYLYLETCPLLLPSRLAMSACRVALSSCSIASRNSLFFCVWQLFQLPLAFSAFGSKQLRGVAGWVPRELTHPLTSTPRSCRPIPSSRPRCPARTSESVPRNAAARALGSAALQPERVSQLVCSLCKHGLEKTDLRLAAAVAACGCMPVRHGAQYRGDDGLRLLCRQTEKWAVPTRAGGFPSPSSSR